MTAVLQNHLPDALWPNARTSKLPGIHPLDPKDWLIRDEAFAGQMALRDDLLQNRRADVHVLDDGARDAAGEALHQILATLANDHGYEIGPSHVRRPDGVRVALDRAAPLATAARLVQEDLCLLQKIGGEHVLTGAVVCFPASWTLAEKFMRPLGYIHGPVAAYDANMAKRVQRLFDLIRVDQPLWRSNFLRYATPDLFAPRSEVQARRIDTAGLPYLRAERQCLLKLPQTQAVVFSIHTYVVRAGDDAASP